MKGDGFGFMVGWVVLIGCGFSGKIRLFVVLKFSLQLNNNIKNIAITAKYIYTGFIYIILDILNLKIFISTYQYFQVIL
jgi:hypothetical protein